MPDPLARPRVEADQAIGKETVSGAISTIEISGRHFHRNVHIPQFFIGAQRRPCAGVACVFPGIVFPCFVAELAGARNRMKSPDPFPRADIEAADVARNVLFRSGRRAREERRADDHSVPNHNRRRAGADLTGLDHRTIEAFGQVDSAIRAERRNRQTGFGVQLHQLVPRRNQEDAFVALTVCPIGKAAVHYTRHYLAARAFVQPVDP